MNKGISVSTKDSRRVIKGLGYYTPRIVKDLRELVKGSAGRHGSARGFIYKDKEGNITGKTYLEFDRDIDYLGTALISMGLKNAYISIIGENRYEWGVSYFSIINGTGVAVPMDKYLPQNEVENLIDRGRAEAVFYSPAFHDMMKDIAKSHDRVRYYICMENIEDISGKDSRFITMPELIKKGQGLLEGGDKSFVDATLDKDKMSVLLFTSGTTSISKGVMLSHSNITSNVSALTSMIYVGPGDVHLSLLPLHHTFENTIGLMFMVHCGVCIAYSDGIKYIAKNLKEYKVSILVAVPAILEAMYRKLQDGIQKSGKAKVVRTLMKISDSLRAIGIDIRRKLFKSILDQLGPNLRLAVSGAAPLDIEVINGFGKIGLTLIQGYGLTETSPVLAACNDFINIPGTLGYPLSGIELAIDQPDENGIGEIVARGDNVMLGYYEDENSTREAIDKDGWFRTGDLGTIDEEGILRITGRAKSMIVLTNGKKAFPEEYEVLLNNIPGVKDSLVWGNKASDGDIQVCTKLVVDKDCFSEEQENILSEEVLASRFDAAIREINKTLPQYKIIRYFVMTYEELVKTTTLKIKRSVEQEKIERTLSLAEMDMRKASGRFIETLKNKDVN